MLKPSYSNQFQKDLKLMLRRGKPVEKFKEVATGVLFLGMVPSVDSVQQKIPYHLDKDSLRRWGRNTPQQTILPVAGFLRNGWPDWSEIRNSAEATSNIADLMKNPCMFFSKTPI